MRIVLISLRVIADLVWAVLSGIARYLLNMLDRRFPFIPIDPDDF